MKKLLVAYFSASGTTAKAAIKLAEALNADIYEIRPKTPYAKADLNWMNKNSRSSVEMNNRSLRPEVITGDLDLSGYDTVFLGFPIWWYVAPTVINSFLESLDWTGKEIVLFATSGSSGFGSTLQELQPSAPGAVLRESRVLSGLITEHKIQGLISDIRQKGPGNA